MIAKKISASIGCENWVIFSHGTIVSFNEKTLDMEEKALNVLQEFGPFKTGTWTADFYPAKALDNSFRLWLIAYPHCNHIFNFINVGKDFEIALSEENAVNIAFAGRDNRKCDADKPRITSIVREE
ncbi:hypothetical protein JYT48_03075 [Mariprofundus ferrooxydans]|nr:hypothetical protein [Mariprofundus ferrooxydans]